MTRYNSNYVITDWKSTLEKCPHCQSQVNIRCQSKASKRDVISQFFLKMSEHLKCCVEKKQTKKISLKITVWSQNIEATNFLSTFEEEKIII